MISSMTGFGRHELTEKGLRVTVEIRSLNNRFLDVFVKISRKYNLFEEDVKALVQEVIARGKIDVSINIEGVAESVQQVSVNLPLAKQYFEAIKSLQDEFGVDISLKPENLLGFEGIFERVIPEKMNEKVKNVVLKAVKAALTELTNHKREEGKNLSIDCKMRLDRIAASVKDVRRLVKERRVESLENLTARITKVLENVEKVDPRRLELEAALMAEKFDVSEECVRLESHLKLFRSALGSKDAAGRRLDFILQEMNREANTIASKSNNYKISEEVVSIKQEVDRLKEQIRNVE